MQEFRRGVWHTPSPDAFFRHNYVCALGVLMVLLLVTMAAIARKLGAKIGIAE